MVPLGSLNVQIIALLSITLITLAADLNTPLGIAGGIPYVIPVLLSAHLNHPLSIVLTALMVTFLTFVGWYFSAPGFSPDWIVLSNRFYALIIIWLTAFLLARRQATREILSKYAAIVASSQDHMSLLDQNYTYQAVNDTYLKFFGKKRNEILGQTVAQLHGQEVFNSIKPLLDRALSGEHVNYQAWFTFPNNCRYYMDVSYEPYQLPDGNIGGFVVNSRDNTAREKIESELMRERSLLRSLIDTIPDPIFFKDNQFKFLDCNLAFEKRCNVQKHEIVGKTAEDLFFESDARNCRTIDNQVISSGQAVELEETMTHPDGSQHVYITMRTFFSSPEGKPLGIIGISRDITERKRAEKEILQLALTDSLTGLANRNQFNSRMEEALQFDKRFNHHAGLILLDLDKFKLINDTFGHPVGDALLVHVARLLESNFREIDTVARLGGDEFAVILNGMDSDYDITVPANKIIDKISRPVLIQEHEIQIGVSIGISLAVNKQETDIETMLKQADEALYQSKREGRNTYRIFNQHKKQI